MPQEPLFSRITPKGALALCPHRRANYLSFARLVRSSPLPRRGAFSVLYFARHHVSSLYDNKLRAKVQSRTPVAVTGHY